MNGRIYISKDDNVDIVWAGELDKFAELVNIGNISLEELTKFNKENDLK